MKRYSLILSLIAAMIIAMPVCCFAAGAEAEADEQSKTEVTVVGSVEELAAESSAADSPAFFTIDASGSSTPESLVTEELQSDVDSILAGRKSDSKKQQAVTDALNDSGYYLALEGEGSDVEVSSKFACRRLRLVADKEKEINAYGAVKAVFYKDHYLLSYDSEESAKLAYEALTEEYGKGSVFIDRPLRISSTQSSRGWGTAYMGMRQEREKAATGGTVTVAVIDTGIRKTHEVFSDPGRLLQGYDFVNGDDEPADDSGHGTGVAGIIAESTPANVRIMPLKTLDGDGDGSTEDTLAALEYADEKGADIINMSLGGFIESWEEEDLDYFEAEFSKYSALMICASGNENVNMDAPGIDQFPGELSCTVCVGAFNTKGERGYYSNYGQAVDFGAPGSDLEIASMYGNEKYVYNSGTSFATPYITSAAALTKAENMSLNNDGILSSLRSRSIDLGDPGRDVYFGDGCPCFGDEVKPQGSGDLQKRAYVVGFSKRMIYTGEPIIQEPSVISEGVLLKKGEDYIIEHSNNTDVGQANIAIIGIGRFEGSRLDGISFEIVPKFINPVVTLPAYSYSYTGSPISPEVSVIESGRTLKMGRDYELTYPEGRTAVGSYTIIIRMKGNYEGTSYISYEITKIPNGLSAAGKTVKIKKSKLKKKALKIARSKVLRVSGASGRLSYRKLSGSSRLKIDKNSGKVTVKKKTKKGTYRIKVRISAGGDQTHYAAEKTVKLTVKVK